MVMAYIVMVYTFGSDRALISDERVFYDQELADGHERRITMWAITIYAITMQAITIQELADGHERRITMWAITIYAITMQAITI